MLTSMTGFGRHSATVNGRVITVEIRSVNHRYLEYSARMPRAYNFLDDRLKKEVAKKIRRGKVDLNLYIQSVEAPDVEVKADTRLAKSYLAAFGALCDELGINNDVSATTFTRIPDIFVTQRVECDEDEMFADVMQVLSPALRELCDMRCIEGEKLAEDIKNRLSLLQKGANGIEKGGDARKKEYYDRLYARLCTLLDDHNIEQSRLVTEAAIFADKISVTEETVRIDSHIKQFLSIMDGDEVAGRKLDFLVQELGREVNTIGSKISDSEVTMTVIEMKSQLEKIREQIQNTE